MNSQNSLLNEAERLLETIKRLQPPAGSRLARLQKRAFTRYVRRFKWTYYPNRPVPVLLYFTGWDDKLNTHRAKCNFGIIPKPSGFIASLPGLPFVELADESA